MQREKEKEREREKEIGVPMLSFRVLLVAGWLYMLCVGEFTTTSTVDSGLSPIKWPVPH